MEFRKAKKNSYQGEHSKQLKEARAGIQAADTVLEQVEILSLEFFFENSVARQGSLFFLISIYPYIHISLYPYIHISIYLFTASQ